MLARVSQEPAVCFAACGKHPALGDYLVLGRDTPMLQAFSRWMEQGFAAGLKTGLSPEWPGSWLFWVQGETEDDIACGRIGLSRDSMGRPYPFLVLGQGLMPGWREQWQGMPLCLTSLWRAMREMAAPGNGDDASGLENALAALTWPGEHAPGERNYSTASEGIDGDVLDKALEDLADQGVFSTLLAADAATPRALAWLASIRSGLVPGSVPDSVFLCRARQGMGLHVFFRPLRPSDFAAMWRHAALTDTDSQG